MPGFATAPLLTASPREKSGGEAHTKVTAVSDVGDQGCEPQWDFTTCPVALISIWGVGEVCKGRSGEKAQHVL